MAHLWASLPLLILVALPVFGNRAEVRRTLEQDMPAQVDSNSPAFWRNGELIIINSTGVPRISRGEHQFAMSSPQPITIDRQDHTPMWIESVWQDEDGTLYGWYHHEPGGVCSGSNLTAPVIGAVISYDGGNTFYDLGLVLTSGDPVDCSAKNGFFAGGHGDFSVILDRDKGYFYFLFDNYGGALPGQGVAVARLAFEDRNNPVGAVWKRFEGEWNEPGLNGRVTPVFRTNVAWQRADTDSLWGPSIHWNTHLETYVVVMNRACCETNWPQKGIYISFNPDLSNPDGWTEPKLILDDIGFGPGYYPQVLGLEYGEPDTVAGRVARLYVHGRSKWEITFYKPGEVEARPPKNNDDPPDESPVP